MLRNLLDENDKLNIKTETMHKFDSLSTKLSSENKMNVENSSEFDEDTDMSEISVEDEVNCSEFLKSKNKPEKSLISENSVAFIRMSKENSKVLKETVVVYEKVQTVLNQVYATTGVTKKQTVEQTSMEDEDNADGCDNFF